MSQESGSVPSTSVPDTEVPPGSAVPRRLETKEVHIRVPIPNYQYLDRLAIRYGIRSLSAAVNFLIEFHRQAQDSPTLGPPSPHAKQAK